MILNPRYFVRKILTILALFGLCVLAGPTLRSQTYPLQCRIRVDSILSNQMEEWSRYDQLHLTLTNTADTAVMFVMEPTILNNENVLAAPAKAQGVRSIAPHASRDVSAAEILGCLRVQHPHSKHAELTNGFDTDDGPIRICINVFDPTRQTALSAANCVPSTVFHYHDNSLSEPADGAVLHNGRGVRFSWTGIQPKPRYCQYQLKIFTKEADAYAAQVVRTHRPVVDTLIDNECHFDWTVPDSLSAKSFVWQVRSSDGRDMLFGSNSGYTEIRHFHGGKAEAVGTDKTAPSSRKATTHSSSTQRKARNSQKKP